MNYFIKLLRLFIVFAKNTYGCINKPYITYRALAKESANIWQTLYIFLFVAGYFSFASLIRTGIRNPYLLTIKFSTLIWVFIMSLLLIVSFLYLLGKLVGNTVNFKSLFILWTYSLLPTLGWFFFTSISYLFLPPPRTMSILGKLYTVLYIAFSLSVLFWKLILYYLTLRFGLRLELSRIIAVSFVFVPILSAYAFVLYKMGIYRIPFI